MSTRLIGIAALLSSALLLSAAASAQETIPGPGVGERFPEPLAAPDQDGRPRTLAELTGPKGAAIFFVRSADWCPFCRGQLVDVNNHFEQFAALGLAVVSVSVDEVPLIKAFADEQKIAYTMLADPAGDINERLGIRDEQYPVGSAQFGVPRPIVYIVDRNGTIRARFMEPTYRTRPDLDQVLAAVRALGL